jgi:hypothetical protein
MTAEAEAGNDLSVSRKTNVQKAGPSAELTTFN